MSFLAVLLALPSAPTAVDVAKGSQLNCAVLSDGGVECWGRGEPRPVRVPGVEGAVQVVVSENRACARTREGRVTCWGPRAPALAALPAAQSIALSESRVYVVTREGRVSFLGRPLARASGKRVVSPASDAHAEAEVREMPGLKDVVEVVAGDGRLVEGCARRRDGAVLCWAPERWMGHGWGTERVEESPIPVAGVRGATGLAVGEGFACARLGDGTARCWGANDQGQLGDGALVERAAAVPVAGLSGVTGITAGGSFACALRGESSTMCWGYSEPSLFGDGSPPRVDATPRSLDAPRFTHLSVSSTHACGLTLDGARVCWGANDEGQLGTGDRVERASPLSGSAGLSVPPEAALPPAISLTASGNTTCAAFADGGARCWGSHEFGQLGDGTRASRRLCPTRVYRLDAVTRIALGDAHACALRRDGTVRCWGANYSGELGQGVVTGIAPVAVPVPGVAEATSLAVGGLSCALLKDRTVSCWGGYDRDDGPAEAKRHLNPSPVPGVRGAVQVAAGGSFACVALDKGGVRCWGRRWAVGRGLERLRDVSGLAAGPGVCALQREGGVQCWGHGGPPYTPERPDGADLRTPSPAPAFRGVTALALGSDQACGLLPDGRVVCQTAEEAPPAAVDGVTEAVEVAVGRAHACVRTAAGVILCWGENDAGQLGDGTTRDRTGPAAVRACVEPAVAE